DLDARMQEIVELVFYRFDHCFSAMTDIEATNASREIEVAVAIDIFEPGIFGLGNVDWRTVRKPAGHGFCTTLMERLGLRSRNRCLQLNRRHLDLAFRFFRPFGAFYLLWSSPTACAVGCILSPLRGWPSLATDR